MRLPNLFDNINNPRISERISFGEININQVNYFNNQISNDNNINIIPPEIEKKVINNNLNQIQLTKSLNLETSDKYFKEFEAINTESVKLKKGNICIYCKSNPAKIILSPCGHRCLCLYCYQNNKEKIKNCPMCRKIIRDFNENIYAV